VVQLKAVSLRLEFFVVRFQFLVVQLKDIFLCEYLLLYAISIPCGSIKSTLFFCHNYNYLISIPCGSIKSAKWILENAEMCIFQFLVVQLKGFYNPI